MSRDERWDAIVIGAGIVRAACARNLAREGMATGHEGLGTAPYWAPR